MNKTEASFLSGFATKYQLANVNSCGQGSYDAAERHPGAALCFKFGYFYSHSTNIGHKDGWILWHTFKHYKNSDLNIGLQEDNDFWKQQIEVLKSGKVSVLNT